MVQHEGCILLILTDFEFLTNHSARSFCTKLCKVPLSKLCLDPRVPGDELRDALGNVVRWCASSLLESYVHQELI